MLLLILAFLKGPGSYFEGHGAAGEMGGYSFLRRDMCLHKAKEASLTGSRKSGGPPPSIGKALPIRCAHSTRPGTNRKTQPFTNDYAARGDNAEAAILARCLRFNHFTTKNADIQLYLQVRNHRNGGAERSCGKLHRNCSGSKVLFHQTVDSVLLQFPHL